MGNGNVRQFKLRLSEEFITRMEGLARKYNRRSANEIAAEIVVEFIDLWEEAESAKRSILDQHRRLTKRDAGKNAKKG